MHTVPTRKSAGLAPLLAAAALLPALAVLASPAAAQRSDAEWLESCRRNRGDRDRAVFCEVRTATMRPTGSIRVESENGGAAVRGSDAAEVRVSSRIQAHARTEGEAQALARRVVVRVENGTVSVRGPERVRGAGWSVSHDIQAPRQQDVSVTTSNGGVSVQDVRGRMTLRSSNGGVSLRRVGGAIHARTSNGGINVELEGGRWNGEGLDAETSNGGISVTLPRDYSADLEVGTTNGRLNLDVPLPEGYRSGQTVRTRLGSGGPRVRAVTTNGGVSVRRASR